MKLTKTNRGFKRGEFLDSNGASCSIQESSAMDSHGLLWLGCNDAPIQVMYDGQIGWHDFVFPSNVHTKLITNRMHLNKAQSKDLIKKLQKFVDTGHL